MAGSATLTTDWSRKTIHEPTIDAMRVRRFARASGTRLILAALTGWLGFVPVSSRAQLLVPANDFRAQWADVGADALAALDRVGRSGWVVLGEEVRAFEAALAEFWGVPHVVGVAS